MEAVELIGWLAASSYSDASIASSAGAVLAVESPNSQPWMGFPVTLLQCWRSRGCQSRELELTPSEAWEQAQTHHVLLPHACDADGAPSPALNHRREMLRPCHCVVLCGQAVRTVMTAPLA